MKPYKTLRFAAGKIPDGLRRSHSLKKGVRGVLRVLSGDLVFVCEADGRRTHVTQGKTISIDAESPHHLEDSESAAVEIDFFHRQG